jgi:hypothetical protein
LHRDPVEFGRRQAVKKPEAFTIGNEAMHQRWADPDGLVILAVVPIANQIVDT